MEENEAEFKFPEEPTGKLYVMRTRTCLYCRDQSDFTLELVKYMEWKSGTLIQNVWPDMPKEIREVLISGIHPSCWKQVFGLTPEQEEEEAEDVQKSEAAMGQTLDMISEALEDVKGRELPEDPKKEPSNE